MGQRPSGRRGFVPGSSREAGGGGGAPAGMPRARGGGRAAPGRIPRWDGRGARRSPELCGGPEVGARGRGDPPVPPGPGWPGCAAGAGEAARELPALRAGSGVRSAEGELSPECSLAAMGWSYFAEVGVPGRQLNRSRHISLKTRLCKGGFSVIR